MKREELYCDVCGNKMSYEDSDGDANVQGIRLAAPLQVHITKRTACGHIGSSRGEFPIDFCSFDCFEKAGLRWIEQVKAASANMQPLL